MGGQGNAAENFNFNFKKGKTAELKIGFPQMEDDNKVLEPEKKEQIPEMDDEMLEMMSAMYKGLKFSVIVEFDGKITDTNASYKEGNKITILNMDFDELAKDPDKLKGFSNMQDPSKMKEFFKDIPEIKAETKEEVFVKFK